MGTRHHACSSTGHQYLKHCYMSMVPWYVLYVYRGTYCNVPDVMSRILSFAICQTHILPPYKALCD
jgi:hypothetical protein